MKTGNLFLAICIASFLAACSDSVTEVVRPVEAVVRGTTDSLPECSSENQGQMAVVSENGLAYVCENSKWESLVSNSGTESCALLALSDSSGYRIVCGDDTVGTVLNGIDGQDGEKGEQGKNGIDGRDCSISDNADGTVLQVCGEDSTVLSKALCGGEPYEPTTHFCYGDRLYKQVVYDTIVDARDGNRYRTVQIGNQTWMADNLRLATDSSNCLGDTMRCLKFGRFYYWEDMIDIAGIYSEPLTWMDDWDLANGGVLLKTPRRGICPEGWHIPTREEWFILFNTVDRLAYEGIGWVLKSRTGWDRADFVAMGGVYKAKHAENGSDLFGFDAKPAGAQRKTSTELILNEGVAAFWTTDVLPAFTDFASRGDDQDVRTPWIQLNGWNGMYQIPLSSLMMSNFRTWHDKERERLSVRCVRDE